MEVFKMTEKYDVKFQQRLETLQEKEKLDATLNSVIESGAAKSRKEALLFIMSKFSEIQDPSNSLKYRFSSELNELQENSENIVRLFSKIIKNTESEILKTKNVAGEKNEELLTKVSEKEEIIKELEESWKQKLAEHVESIAKMQKGFEDALAEKDELLEAHRVENLELTKKNQELTGAIVEIEKEKDELKKEKESLTQQVTSKENMYNSLYSEKLEAQQSMKEAVTKYENQREVIESLKIENDTLQKEHREEIKAISGKFEVKIDDLNRNLNESLKDVISLQQKLVTPTVPEEKTTKTVTKKDTKLKE